VPREERLPLFATSLSPPTLPIHEELHVQREFWSDSTVLYRSIAARRKGRENDAYHAAIPTISELEIPGTGRFLKQGFEFRSGSGRLYFDGRPNKCQQRIGHAKSQISSVSEGYRQILACVTLTRGELISATSSSYSRCDGRVSCWRFDAQSTQCYWMTRVSYCGAANQRAPVPSTVAHEEPLRYRQCARW
jgi:hypothetical protein